MSDTLLVFVKEPRPGAVKTRLAAGLGAVRAAAVYRSLAEAVIRQTAPAAQEYERLFCFAPKAAIAAMTAWLPGESLLAQQGDDLGARMAHAFAEAFHRGARRVAIVGSDAPAVDRTLVAGALRALDDHDVAIGPARDGGYYLLALDQPRPELFQGVAWSSSAVFTSTVERAAVLGLGVRILDACADIDTLDDLRAEWPRVQRLLDPALVDELALELASSGRKEPGH
jgi:uncharacterized protein